ncbi:MAG: glyoxalase/bleomycin resistance/extradiol dioxygenase family protein [Rhodospirillaceae bacterium]|jgi:2,3-dihydroxy-p-cumate/2,3-dihydroxybenzoate 3,4-dioxygenase|nr:glyoxalase/bleomycin resistance/extradiol dioxygenase family protein [Rhodospirillaceae bacterium]MBT5940012.1 glyoxalase/bleomycin resistance/extradiol dioxygenase family protein [Rhodospirillaceae bacterium]MBT7267628.1 glyoxalase/bleomycin resistance/extradiol dioxygenase family protein [Rhodospirillaceae bacterium]
MIILKDLCYIRLGTQDLEGAERFATEIVGLQAIRRSDDRLYLRSNYRDHSLCYFEGAPDDHMVGIELKDWAGLDEAMKALEQAGYPCTRGTEEEALDRQVEDFCWFKDPTGNRIELVVRPHDANRRFFQARDAGLIGLGHIGLNSTDPTRDEKFWTTHFNMRVSDWIGKSPLLRMKNIHHQIALFPTTKPGVQHINHQVDSIDDIMRSWYFLQGHQIRIVFGPGRHVTSGGYFLYYEGHDGMVFEYSNSDRNIIDDDENYRPRQFPMSNESFCAWGSKPDIPEFQS